MARSCTACGKPLRETQIFCDKCGTAARSAVPSMSFQATALRLVQRLSTSASVSAPPPRVKKGSVTLRIFLILLVVLAAGGSLTAAGVLCAACSPGPAIAAPLPVDTSSEGTVNANNACALLTPQEIREAIGVEITQIQPQDSGCEYLAKGSSSEMAAKHMEAFLRARGTHSRPRKTPQGFSQALFLSAPSHPKSREEETDAEDTTAILAVSIEQESAAALALDQAAFRRLGPDAQSIPGLGDEAFDIAGGTLVIHKGGKTVRILYITCPCGAQAMIPLAKKLLSRV